MLDFINNIFLDGDDIPALFGLRQKGKDAFLGFPDKKDEPFKYTPVSSYISEEMFSPSSNCCDNAHCHCHDAFLSFPTYEYHFCNGALHEHFSPVDGVEISSLLDAFLDHSLTAYLNKFDLSKFPFAALNTAYLEQGVFMRFSKTLDKPVALIYHNHESGFKNLHNIVVVEKNAQIDLIEYYHGEHNPYFINIVNEIYVSKNALMKHYLFQDESENAVHIGLSNVQIKSGGTYQSYAFHKGGKLTRNETHILLKEENASALVNAAYNLKNKTFVDTTTDIEHLSKSTKSNQIIRGVLNDNTHGVFQGKIHIDPNAVQTEGYQIHKALLLSDEARIDVKPELEIFADDVKCSHGATSGDLNKDELFYLQSRGISEIEARKILVKAFLTEVSSDISNPDISELCNHFFFD